MRKVLTQLSNYLNPISRLGLREYSIWFPLSSGIIASVLLEVYVYIWVKDPNVVSLLAIFIFIAMIIYFSFRDGVRGGLILTGITLAYYSYIIYTRHYIGKQLVSGVQTLLIFGILYFFLAIIIGWLKQTIDCLVEQETNEKRRLESIIQQLPVGVLVTDSYGKIVQANKQLNKILGIAVPVGCMVGESILLKSKKNGKSIHPSQSPLSQVLTTGKSIVDQQFTIEREGKQAYLQVSAAPIHNKAGKIIAAASIISDITHQKEIEKRKDDFVNMASHELKTPLTSMKLFINSLMRRVKVSNDKQSGKILDNISRQTQKLQDLVSDLLDVSRLQTGKLAFTKEEFVINDVINETVEGVQGAVKKQKIIFSQKKKFTVLGDRFRIYQVLTNFLTNAIKYSPEGKDIIIRIKGDKKEVTVSVEDFGIGIDKDQYQKIFDRLYQVTDDKEKTFPGLGMGLYISKEIIQRHKGSIWVESRKGYGSIFYFSLPLPKKQI